MDFYQKSWFYSHFPPRAPTGPYGALSATAGWLGWLADGSRAYLPVAAFLPALPACLAGSCFDFLGFLMISKDFLGFHRIL